MAFGSNGRVNIVFTNHVLRYSYHKAPTLDSLVNHGEVDLPEGTIVNGIVKDRQGLVEIINELVQTNKWKRKKIYFCVPDDTVVIRQLDVPASLSKKEIIGYLKTQIGNSFHLPFSNPAIDIEIVGEDKGKQNILLFAYPKDKINDFKNLFSEAGLVPIVADLTSLSVYRYYYMQVANSADDVLLIQWNTDSLVTTAFNKQKAVFTRYRNLDRGIEIQEENIKQFIEEQIVEVNRIIDFYQYNVTNGSSSMKQILISGDFPHLKRVKNELELQLSIPVMLVDEANKSIDTSSKYTDVFGLAMKQEA
ncbi:type IV pilus biogenesis protein PilM [Virgibacillus flavescens]|uniref:type IV pilus biogenesis protein PilM n=1 Tax=Virgibacillus flavescens TaxID=1611422 RepID=UPI003D32C6C7